MIVTVQRFGIFNNEIPVIEKTVFYRGGTNGVAEDDKRLRPLPGREGEYLFISAENFFPMPPENGARPDDDSDYWQPHKLPVREGMRVVNEEEYNEALQAYRQKKKEQEEKEREEYEAKVLARNNQKKAILVEKLGLSEEDACLLLT